MPLSNNLSRFVIINLMQEDLTSIIQITQFLHLFAPVFRFSQDTPFTPDDVKHAIQYPEIDPLCGQIVTKMLARKLTRHDADDTTTPLPLPPLAIIKYE